MGDTGSLTLGGILGLASIIVKQEVLMIIVGGIFIAEAVSVLLQKLFYKLTKEENFSMCTLAPPLPIWGGMKQKLPTDFGSLQLCWQYSVSYYYKGDLFVKTWHSIIYIVVALLGFSIITVFSNRHVNYSIWCK